MEEATKVVLPEHAKLDSYILYCMYEVQKYANIDCAIKVPLPTI